MGISVAGNNQPSALPSLFSFICIHYVWHIVAFQWVYIEWIKSILAFKWKLLKLIMFFFLPRVWISKVIFPTALFSVMCYNVLCDKYATRQLYGYCPSWALNWDYRKKAIIQEILSCNADIISLQVSLQKSACVNCTNAPMLISKGQTGNTLPWHIWSSSSAILKILALFLATLGSIDYLLCFCSTVLPDGANGLIWALGICSDS